MSSWLEAIILGIVQGLTEFLPVSSSGHLEIARFLLGDDQIGEQGLLMTITLHAATALATLLVYRKDVSSLLKGSISGDREARDYCLKIVLSMLPAVALGLLFESNIEQLFKQNMSLIASMLLVTGILLLLSERMKKGNKPVNFLSAVLIGIGQAVAIMPGISRSGATISLALMLGVDKTKAARFSFLMVIPLIFGKMAKDILDGDFASADVDLLALLLGFITAFFAGWLACKWIIAIVRRAQLHYFAIYCFIIAALLWIW